MWRTFLITLLNDERVASLDYYFKKIKCGPFFHSVKTKMIEIGLDNLSCEKIPAETDDELV